MITSWSDTEIRVKVPDNTWSGDVVMKVGGVESSRQRFELDLPAHLKQMTQISMACRDEKFLPAVDWGRVVVDEVGAQSSGPLTFIF